jgi:hypothetical protein
MLTEGQVKPNHISKPRLEVQRKHLQTLALIENTAKGLSRQPLQPFSEEELDIKRRVTSMVLLDTWFGYAPKRASIQSFVKSGRERD